MRMTEKRKSREQSYRVCRMERAMFREGKLKRKYYHYGMSKAEFKRRLMGDLKHEV
jgi:hypothetical protein